MVVQAYQLVSAKCGCLQPTLKKQPKKHEIQTGQRQRIKIDFYLGKINTILQQNIPKNTLK